MGSGWKWGVYIFIFYFCFNLWSEASTLIFLIKWRWLIEKAKILEFEVESVSEIFWKWLWSKKELGEKTNGRDQKGILSLKSSYWLINHNLKKLLKYWWKVCLIVIFKNVAVKFKKSSWSWSKKRPRSSKVHHDLLKITFLVSKTWPLHQKPL